MCGIAGFVGPAPEPGARAELHRAVGLLHHRGPDDHGTWFLAETEGGGAVGFASTRLAILDLTSGGRQPMLSADGRWALVFNGEIYNFQELRRELEARGREFRSHSDTEVLLQSFAEWGLAVLPRLTGMFAFAIHDRVARRVTLARDPFGIKPLYYAFNGDALVFASELPAVLDLAQVSREVDPQRYQSFLLSGSTDFGGGTLFAQVRQVPAGHFMELAVARPQEASCQCYWRPDLSQELDCSFEV